MFKPRIIVLVAIIIGILQIGHVATTSTHLTILNIKSAFANNGRYQCYPSESGTTITFGKAFRISTSDSLAEQPGVVQSSFYPSAKEIYIPFDSNFFGVYYCKGVINGNTTTVSTTIVDLEDAFTSVVTPTNEKTTITASVGEAVTVSFEVTTSGDRIWRKDGVLLDDYQNMYAETSLNFNSVQIVDAGIYELYVGASSRTQYRHSFIELIVRGCEAGRWGARCTGICHNCYNGGVCDDETGSCICAPGFSGNNCETTCGGNRFGLNCEIRCTLNGDPKDRCKSHHFCLNKPYGCDCVTGFTGLTCLTGCDSGRFGAGCSQECHCASEIAPVCNQYTGECSSGGCASGWSGSNCQVPSICPVGYYGTSCTLICHCFGNVKCDRISGACSNGRCEAGYHNIDDTFCQICESGSYGFFCDSICNCQPASCHHGTGCDGGCNANWLPDTCTTGIISSTNIKVNPGQPSVFTCTIQGDVTGVTVRLYIDTEPVVETGRTESNGVTEVQFSGEASLSHSYRFYITNNSESTNLNHSIDLFNLPTYYGIPVAVSVTGWYVELVWREWSTSVGDRGDPPVVGYVVHYKETSSSGIWRNTSLVDQPTAAVTGLNWEERYDFAVAAVRDGIGGEGPRSSQVVSVSTSCGEPSSPEVTTNSSYKYPKQIDVSWQPLTVTDAKCSTGVQTYKVSYKPDNTEAPSTIVTTSTSYIIENLETFTQYIITVTARNRDLYGTAKVTHVFSPEEKPPVPDVTAIHGGSFITVFVKPSDSVSQNLYGNIHRYDIRYRSVGNEWEIQTVTEDEGRTGYKITNIENADYEVSARVINGGGTGSWSCSTQAKQTTGSSIPTFMIVIVICLIVVIIVISLVLCLFCRYHYSNEGNSIKYKPRDTQIQGTEQPTVSYDYTTTIASKSVDDLIKQENYYDVNKIKNGETDEQNEDYEIPVTYEEIPMKYVGQDKKHDLHGQDVPVYYNR